MPLTAPTARVPPGLQVNRRKISGILAYPGISRNGNLYTEPELMRGDGVTVPLYHEHEDFQEDDQGHPTGRILNKEPVGAIKLHWDPEMKLLKYEGFTNDPRPGVDKVSLAAEPAYFEPGPDGTRIPRRISFFSASDVEHPGLPLTTLELEFVREGMKTRPKYYHYVVEGAGELREPDRVGRMVIFESETFAEEEMPTGATNSTTKLASTPFEKELDAEFDDGGRAAALTMGPGPAGAQHQPRSDFTNTDPTDVMPPHDPGGQEGVVSPDQNRGLQPGFQLSTNAGTGVMSDKGVPVGTRQVPVVNPNIDRGVEPEVANFQDPTQGAEGSGLTTAWPETQPWAPQPGPVITTMPYKGGQLARPAQALLNSVFASTRANNSGKRASESKMATAAKLKEDSGEAEPAQDSSTKNANDEYDAPARAVNAGPQFTPYEKLLRKLAEGKITIAEQAQLAQLVKAKLKEESDHKAGFTGSQPGGEAPGMKSVQDPLGDDNPVAEEEAEKEAADFPVSKGPAGSAANPQRDDRGVSIDEEEEEADKMCEAFSFTRQEWRKTPAPVKERLRLMYRKRRLTESGVNVPDGYITKKRESRGWGDDINQQVMKSALGENAIKYGFGAQVMVPNGRTWKPMSYEAALDEMYRICEGTSDKQGWRFLMPTFVPPAMGVDGAGLREFNTLFESYRTSRIDALSKSTRFIREAIDPTTTGFASGTEAMTPALVIPNQLAGLSRETVLFTPLPQGYKQHEFQMTTATNFALTTTYNTDPGSTDPTLTAVNVTTNEYTVEHQIAFSGERKGIGPQLDAFILGDRLGALYLDDKVVFGTIGSGGIENGSVPTSNLYYGNGTVTAESSITSSMTMAYMAISTTVKNITSQGYSPDNLVCFMHPKPYNDLLNDPDIVRYLQNPVASGDYRDALIARGVIPLLNGVEIRRSTLVKTGTGSPSTVGTYHTYVYKKGLSVAMAASRDLMIETFRNIQQNSTYTKSHIDYGAQVLHPASIGIIYTA